MTTKVRWGILSTAYIAQDELLPAFTDASNAEVVAIASSNNKVYEIASKFRIPKIYGTYEELLDDPDIDAVYIPLPNALHSFFFSWGSNWKYSNESKIRWRQYL